VVTHGSTANGIRNQRQQRGEVRQREQAVHLIGEMRARKPRLHQRPGGGKQKIRQPDGEHQQAENAVSRVFIARGLPRRIGYDGQPGEAHNEQRGVQNELRARLHPARGEIGVGVAEEQQKLEKHQARAPHRGGAAEPRQNLLGHDRLHQEQQKGAGENRKRVQNYHLKYLILKGNFL